MATNIVDNRMAYREWGIGNNGIGLMLHLSMAQSTLVAFPSGTRNFLFNNTMVHTHPHIKYHTTYNRFTCNNGFFYFNPF
jgi:hypothetical protein